MGKLNWYKRHALDALEGMANMTLEESGAYSKVLDLIYLNDGNLRDDAAYLCRWLNCDRRVWSRLRARLIELGKLSLADGILVNRRAANEVAKTVATRAASVQLGRQGGLKTQQNNRLAQGSAIAKEIEDKKKEKEKEDVGVSDSAREPEPEPIATASRYRYAGSIIKLNERDFNRWQKSFPNLDLDAHLTGLDAWLSGEEATDRQRKNWFNVVPNALCKRQQAAVNEKKNGRIVDYRERYPDIPG